MNTRLASTVAAVFFSLGAIASPALAKDHAPSAVAAAGTALNGVEIRRYDDITTGSIGHGRGHDSAQEGNANQPNFVVQQYGQTSGGPAR